MMTVRLLSRFNGENSIALQVITTGLDDITETVQAAKEVVAQWHTNGRLPQGVELSSWYDRSQSITERLAAAGQQCPDRYRPGLHPAGPVPQPDRGLSGWPWACPSSSSVPSTSWVTALWGCR